MASCRFNASIGVSRVRTQIDLLNIEIILPGFNASIGVSRVRTSLKRHWCSTSARFQCLNRRE